MYFCVGQTFREYYQEEREKEGERVDVAGGKNLIKSSNIVFGGVGRIRTNQSAMCR